MKKLLNIALCLTIGLALAGCNTTTETPIVDVEVEGDVVEVILPPEFTDAVEAAIEIQDAATVTDTEEVIVETE